MESPRRKHSNHRRLRDVNHRRRDPKKSRALNGSRRFRATLAEVCAKSDWQLHAWWLMRITSTWWSKPQGQSRRRHEVVSGHLRARFNRRHKLFGHLFSGTLQNPVSWMAAAAATSSLSAIMSISIPRAPNSSDQANRSHGSPGTVTWSISRRRPADGKLCAWIVWG